MYGLSTNMPTRICVAFWWLHSWYFFFEGKAMIWFGWFCLYWAVNWMVLKWFLIFEGSKNAQDFHLLEWIKAFFDCKSFRVILTFCLAIEKAFHRTPPHYLPFILPLSPLYPPFILPLWWVFIGMNYFLAKRNWFLMKFFVLTLLLLVLAFAFREVDFTSCLKYNKMKYSILHIKYSKME
jgi:hypothetical protein